jgi:4-diphosphocytidyl-2-C-methyl-D-erythritol kinase
MATFFEGDTRNDCQQLVRQLYPEVDNALKLLDKFGEAKLTGTGACVFTSFATAEQAGTAREQLPPEWRSILARGVNISPTASVLANSTG